MKSLTPIKAMLGALALAALAPLGLEAQSRPTFIGNPNLVRGPEVKLNQTTDATLARLADQALAGIEWQSAARTAGLKVLDDMVLVEVSGLPADAADSSDAVLGTLAGIIYKNGGEILPGATAERCRAYIRPDALSELENGLTDGVREVRITAYRAPITNAYGMVASEGESAMGSQLYQLNGNGVTVAVMDVGFEGMLDSESGRVALQSQLGFDRDATSHGAAMVEVIRDLAPDARIIAYRIDENMDIYAATLNAVRQGVDVIVSPLSFVDLPGHSLADRAVKIAIDNGVQWVQAAGNFADARYFEAAGAESFGLSGESFLAFGHDDPYQFISDAGEQIRIHLAQELQTDSALLALELYSWDGMSADLILESAGNHHHRVQTVIHTSEPGKYYFPMIRVAQPGDVHRIRMFSETGSLFFSSTEGSIACPGGASEMITVGAVDVQNYNQSAQIEPYSGRSGGIFDLNLSLCGPTNCTTGTYGPQGFSGTSAAAAHIGGLVALHMSDSGLAKDPLGLIRKLDIMGAGPDHDSGAGIAMAQLDDAEPDNDIEQATDLIAASQAVTGRSLSPSDDRDWFTFEITEQMSADITFTGNVPSVQLFKINDDSDLAGTLDVSDDFNLQAMAGLNHTVLQPGRYAILVSGGFAAGYDVFLDLYQDAPEAVTEMSPADGEVLITSHDMADAAVALKWSAPQGLGPISYQVQLADAADSRSILVDEMTDATSLIVAGLEVGKTYVWNVIAMNEHGVADPSPDYTFTLSDDFGAVIGSGDVNDDASATQVFSGDITVDALLAPHGMEDGSDNAAAGCAGNTGGNGLIALLMAMVAAAVMIKRKREQTKA